MEKLIWEIPGVEYVYSTSSPGQSMVVVRFLVGQDQERAFVRLREKLQSHYDSIPPGASTPTIKPHSIDDVPILALTLHSATVSSSVLRQLAVRLEREIKSVPSVSESLIIGGRKRELRVVLRRGAMQARQLDVGDVLGALQAANNRSDAGLIAQDNNELSIRAGEFFRSAADVEGVVIPTPDGKQIYVRDIATVLDGAEEPTNYVFFGRGPASESEGSDALESAVTISIAKRQGVNAVEVVHNVLAKVERLKGTLIPSDVEVSVLLSYWSPSP